VTLDARPVAFDYPRMVGHVGESAMTKSIAIVVASCLAILVAAEGNAFAQAGSIGGTVGKTDKSASGGENSEPQPRRRGVVRPHDVAVNLTGEWSCDDGGTYTIRQSGSKVSWEGVGILFTHTFNGVIKNNIIDGKFFDHPPGVNRLSGELKVRIIDANRMEKVEACCNFGGSVWTR
jgi:hypothetical protein